MSASRRWLPTEAPPARAAVVVLAHRRDPQGVPWARAPIADGDALDTVLGTAATAGLWPRVVVVGPGDPRPPLADVVLEVAPTASVEDAMHTARAALSAGSPPSLLLVIPVEQPLASGTLLWTLVAAAEDAPDHVVVAGHHGEAGHPRVERFDAPHRPSLLSIVEAGEVALFWTGAFAGGAHDEPIRARARVLLATASVMKHALEDLAADAVSDLLAAEEPLEIRLGDAPLAVVMRTPGHDVELTTGFLLTEAVVHAASEIRGLVGRGNRIVVDVDPAVTARAGDRRSFYASSACGVCGKSSIDEVVLRFPRVRSELAVARDVLWSLPARLAAAQAVFARTGGLHAAALFDASGELRVLREDVGRHNAVDKVVGWAAAAGALPLDRSVLVVSGRIGFEIAQKATAAGIPVVAAVGAPSSLAVSLASQSGVTLVGFLREGRGNVYTHRARIV